MIGLIARYRWTAAWVGYVTYLYLLLRLYEARRG